MRIRILSQQRYFNGITPKSNETVLLDESRENCISGNFGKCNFQLFQLVICHIKSRDVYSQWSSLEWKPHPVMWELCQAYSSCLLAVRATEKWFRWWHFRWCFYCTCTRSEGIPNRGSLPPSTLIFTTICFRVCIDDRSVSARLGLTIRGLPTIKEQAITNIDLSQTSQWRFHYNFYVH